MRHHSTNVFIIILLFTCRVLSFLQPPPVVDVVVHIAKSVLSTHQHHLRKIVCLAENSIAFHTSGNDPGHVQGWEDVAFDLPCSSSRFSISRPVIRWTVPGYKIGWQDKDGNWFDEDGPRNGPPQNYWRQSSDEREYNRDMDAVTSILLLLEEEEHNNNNDEISNEASVVVEKMVQNLEERCSVRKRSLSRKILGSWAPLLHCGKCVVSHDTLSNFGGSGGGLERGSDIYVPIKIHIYRSNGRKFGQRNHYGLFDANLENGEKLTIETSSANSACATARITVHEGNDHVILGLIGYCHAGLQNNMLPLSFGGITYISDYVLIQRNAEGAIDFWLRCDDSYLGVFEEYEETDTS